MDAIGNELLFPARHGQNERMIALGRKAWLFAGSDRGGDRAAVMFTLIQTAKLNDVDRRRSRTIGKRNGLSPWIERLVAWLCAGKVGAVLALMPQG